MRKVGAVDRVTSSLIVGAIALMILIFLMGHIGFSNYLINEIVWFFLSAFFIVPLVKIVLYRGFDPKDKIPVIFGLTGMFFYSVLTQMSFNEWMVLFLQTIVTISILSVVFVIFKEELHYEKKQ